MTQRIRPARLSALQRTLRFAALLSASAVVIAAEPGRLQPIADQSVVERHVGKFVFAELITPDLGAAKQFYGSLFGWTFRDVHLDKAAYTEASLDGQLVGGMYERTIRPGEQRQPAWLNFIAASDVDAVGRTALSRGARMLLAPHEVPGRGRIAVYADPEGAVFGVMASTSGDPSDVLAAPGEWIWHSLFATNTDGDIAFYQTLFDYDVFDVPEEKNGESVVLAADGFARASANALPSSRGHAHWLSYIRVVDANKTASRVLALGGKVLLAPRDDRHGGKIAVVADAQGAPFGLLEWPEDRDPRAAR